MTPIKVICPRVGVAYDTFRAWQSAARTALEKNDSELSVHERLCRQLVTRLEGIHKQHQQTLIDTIKEPEHAKTARLVLTLCPEWNFVESFGSV